MIRILSTLAKCWICDNVYVDPDVKVIDHSHILERYVGSADRNCNIDVKLKSCRIAQPKTF